MGAPVWLEERCCLKFYEHVLIFPDPNGFTDHSILHYIPIYQVRTKIAVLFMSRDVQIAVLSFSLPCCLPCQLPAPVPVSSNYITDKT